MRLLLDTHALLWFLTSDPRLGHEAGKLIQTGANDLLISVGSCWELSIKCSLGKINIGKPFDRFLWPQLRSNGIDVLPIREEHLNTLLLLPHHHRDPFDRLIVAQAISEGTPLVSADFAMDAYGASRGCGESRFSAYPEWTRRAASGQAGSR